jgi:hypothetical protein
VQLVTAGMVSDRRRISGNAMLSGADEAFRFMFRYALAMAERQERQERGLA